MPNFWTKTTQYFAEAFKGPRTKDTDFDLKVEEMKLVEKGVLALKGVFQNFLNSTVSIRTLCRDVYNSIKCVYDKNSPYFSLANDIHDVHTEIEKFYEEFHSNTMKLYAKTTEWNMLFAQAKNQIQKREEGRKVYDHYDEKLEKIYKNKQERARKNISETTKDLEFTQRNENKYKKATEEYVKVSETAYETIQLILDKRYEIINPVLSEFIEEERIFFTSTANIFRKFEGVGNKFQQISQSIVKVPVKYDPCKFIRGGELIQKEKEKEVVDNITDFNPWGRNRSRSDYRHASKRDDIPRAMQEQTRSQFSDHNSKNKINDGSYNVNSKATNMEGAPSSQGGNDYTQSSYAKSFPNMSNQNMGSSSGNRQAILNSKNTNQCFANDNNQNAFQCDFDFDFDKNHKRNVNQNQFDFDNNANTFSNMNINNEMVQVPHSDTNINNFNFNNPNTNYYPNQYPEFSFDNVFSNANTSNTSTKKSSQGNVTISSNNATIQVPTKVVCEIVKGIPRAVGGIANVASNMNINQNNFNFGSPNTNVKTNTNPKSTMSDDIFKDLF